MNQRVRKTHQQFMDACNQEARRVLLNRRIVEVRYLTPDECQRQMWSFTGVAMVLDDGTTVYPARDAEGNDAGALHGVSGDGTDFVLPEILCPAMCHDIRHFSARVLASASRYCP